MTRTFHSRRAREPPRWCDSSLSLVIQRQSVLAENVIAAERLSSYRDNRVCDLSAASDRSSSSLFQRPAENCVASRAAGISPKVATPSALNLTTCITAVCTLIVLFYICHSIIACLRSGDICIDYTRDDVSRRSVTFTNCHRPFRKHCSFFLKRPSELISSLGSCMFVSIGSFP